MINKNTIKNKDSQLRTQSPKFQNSTTNKQRGSFVNVHEVMENSPLRPSSRVIEQIVEDRAIEHQPEYHQRRQPTNFNISSPRRSLIRQNELWQSISKPTHSNIQELRLISDEYYGEHVPHQTLTFLEKIRSLLSKQEESLLGKRKNAMHDVITSIRAEFGLIRQQLMHLVDSWCRKTEEEEVQYFIQKGDIAINGEIVELCAKITSRREEIEAKISQMSEVMAQQQLISKDEVLKANQYIKNTIREVWSRNYQFQVSELQEETYHLSKYQPTFFFSRQRGLYHEKTLHLHISNMLRQYELFQLPSMKENLQTSPPTKQKPQNESLSPPSSSMKQQILQSLLESRLLQIDRQSKRMMTQYGLE